MDNDLRRFEYGNPENVMLMREARTCKGCSHIEELFGKQYCAKGKKMDKKCKSYKEKA